MRGTTAITMSPYIIDSDRAGELVSVNVSVYASPDLVVSQLISGNLDAAAVPVNLASILHHRDPGILLAGISGTGMLYVIAKQGHPVLLSYEGTEEMARLSGQTLHTFGRGATPDVLTRVLAEQANMEPGVDFFIEYLADQTELAQKMIAGNIDLAVLPEPFVTRVLAGNPDLKLAFSLQSAYQRYFQQDYFPMTAVVIRREFLENHPKAAAAWLADMPAAYQWLSENLGLAAESGAEAIGLTPQMIIASFPRLNLTWIDARESTKAVDQYLNALHRSFPASIGGSVPASDFYLLSSCNESACQ